MYEMLLHQIYCSFGQAFRPSSQSGRPLSGVARPGSQAGRPGTVGSMARKPGLKTRYSGVSRPGSQAGKPGTVTNNNKEKNRDKGKLGWIMIVKTESVKPVCEFFGRIIVRPVKISLKGGKFYDLIEAFVRYIVK